jgi:hypothetical protein
VVTIARMCLLEVSRRRGVLLLMALLPLWFYLVRRDHTGQSIRLLALGVAWAVSTLALFTSCSARSVEQRLRVHGFGVRKLFWGRQLAMLTVGLALAGGYFVMVLLDGRPVRTGALGAILLIDVLVAAPLGTLLGAFVPRELEGALALLSIVAVQLLSDPADRYSVLLPFWSTPEIGYYAVDGRGTEYLLRGLGHGLSAAVLLCVGAVLLSSLRLRLQTFAEPCGETIGRTGR